MKELINRYVWIVDTLNRYGHLSREELNDLWMKRPDSDGNPMPARTFYHYRRAIEENFHLDIQCDKSGRYYIDQGENGSNPQMTNWLLESYSVNNAIKDSAIPSDRVSVEEVPSAREYLPIVLAAIGDRHKITFTYAGFSKSLPEKDIRFLPCFVKRYKQRWYMIGIRERSGDVRTYALDRVKAMQPLNEQFEMPDLSPSTFFENLIGITSSKADVRNVRIMTTPTQAKYFRALPFHHTQQEALHDNYSIFSYRLKLNYELVHELLSFGDSLKVLAPKELQIMITQQLRQSLALYDNPESIPGAQQGDIRE